MTEKATTEETTTEETTKPIAEEEPKPNNKTMTIIAGVAVVTAVIYLLYSWGVGFYKVSKDFIQVQKEKTQVEGQLKEADDDRSTLRKKIDDLLNREPKVVEKKVKVPVQDTTEIAALNSRIQELTDELSACTKANQDNVKLMPKEETGGMKIQIY